MLLPPAGTPRPSHQTGLGRQRPPLGVVSVAVLLALVITLVPLPPHGSGSANAAVLTYLRSMLYLMSRPTLSGESAS
jgi:hypothetical protein